MKNDCVWYLKIDGKVFTDLPLSVCVFSGRLDFGGGVNQDTLESSLNCLMFFGMDFETSYQYCFDFCEKVVGLSNEDEGFIYSYDVAKIVTNIVDIPEALGLNFDKGIEEVDKKWVN